MNKLLMQSEHDKQIAGARVYLKDIFLEDSLSYLIWLIINYFLNNAFYCTDI